MALVDLGKILYVDLTDGSTRIDRFTPELAEAYIGSRGYNARLLWEMVRPGTDPLGPDNVIIFGCGLLNGTSVPSSGRLTVTCKSPATGIYLKTNIGGQFGNNLRYTGFSYIVITGQASNPVYLWVDDDRVQIRDGRPLWGMDVLQVTKAIQQELGDRDIKVACIGPAGERLVMYSGIMCGYNTAGRGGAGAIMGSKKLKAIAVRGTQPVMVADPQAFKAALDQSWQDMLTDPSFKGLHDYGTSGGLLAMSESLHVLPSYNFQKASFEGAGDISGEAMVDRGYVKRRMACAGCAMGCHRYEEIEKGQYKGNFTGGPEYETLSALGSGCGLSEMEYIIEANRLCNIYGLDSISTGAAIQWLMECHERELDFDRNGMDLGWGNGETVVELVRKIAFREGIGDLLAKGLKQASIEMGQGSEKWAVQAKGLEQSRVDTRSALAYALAFAVNPRGPDHLHTEAIAEFGESENQRRIIAMITGDEKYANPLLEEKRAEIVLWHEDVYAVTDALGLCAFTSTAGYYMSPELMAEFFQAFVGKPMDAERIMVIGRRIVTIEKCFNVREGLTRADDRLPWRLMNEAPLDRPQLKNSEEQLNRMLDQYYQLHGWDPNTSWPYSETLSSLGLTDIADQLAKINRLPKRSM